ncbi:MAG: hypothetical protein ACR2LR_25840 [Hassallia sp.]
MKKNKLDNLQPYQPMGKKALASKPLCVKVSLELDQAVRSLPDTSAWLRRVIEEAARAEGIYDGEED